MHDLLVMLAALGCCAGAFVIFFLVVCVDWKAYRNKDWHP